MPKRGKRGNGWKQNKTRKTSSDNAICASKKSINKKCYEKSKKKQEKNQIKTIQTNKRIVLRIPIKRRLAPTKDVKQIQKQSQSKINELQSVIHQQRQQIHHLRKRNTKFQNQITRKNKTINSLSMDLSHIIMTETLVSDTEMNSNDDEFIISTNSTPIQ
eukprot:483598_1